MPFDPFFSSANKHHYVRSEKYEQDVMPEVKSVMAEMGLEIEMFGKKEPS